MAGLDFNKVKGEVKKIVGELENKNLNAIVNVPTVENIASYLIQKLKNFPIHRIKVWEEADRYAEVYT